MKYGFPLFLFLYVSQLSAQAQHDGILRGRLKDTATASFVVGATITVLNTTDSSLVSFGRSQPSGAFLLRGLDKGIYRVLITHIGYRNETRGFLITESIREFDPTFKDTTGFF